MSKPEERIITLELLRKRSEHNEGLVSSLEELALHQEELQSIGHILGRTCGKTLKILLLQNNVISRMVPNELKLFRSLEYINLALNNITKVEGVRNMEFLRKLDLTLNFINVNALEESLDELCNCRSLEELFLLGNPCMGLQEEENDGGSSSIPGSVDGSNDNAAADTMSLQKQQQTIGWKGCRAYIVARLPNLQYLDGKEIKRSERILAMQQLPSLTTELHSLAEARRREQTQQQQQQQLENDKEEEAVEKSYIADDEPTHHNPETRTKLSNELYDQKQAKEKQENANQPPKPKGEKEWAEEHADTVQKVREREERGRVWECSNNDNNAESKKDSHKKDGGIKQCNQGKYEFWFEEEESVKNDGNRKKLTGTLVMRVAIPKYLSTSLIDVDIHPTYVSIVIKSKILRVILPVEVTSTQSVARRSAASGYLELVMPKADPNEVVIGLGHVRDTGKDRRKAMKELDSDCNKNDGTEAMMDSKEKKTLKKRERLGQSLMKEAGVVESLKIVQSREGLDHMDAALNSGCDDDNDDDEPPPLF